MNSSYTWAALCALIQAFGDAFELAWEQPTFYGMKHPSLVATEYNSKNRIMKRTLIISLTLMLCLSGCGIPEKSDQNTERKEASEELKPLMSESIEIVSVETGWYGEQRPQIKIKFRNKSGNPISDFVKIKYLFVENEEVFDEGSEYLHSSSDVNWDNGLSKSKTIRSAYGYPYGGNRHKVTAKVLFDDNSTIWEGAISQKVIY